MNSRRCLPPGLRLAGAFLAAAAILPLAAQDDLPKRDKADRLDFEPALRLYDVKPEAGAKGTVPWEEVPADEGKAQSAADRAKQKADRWQALQKRGIVSKVEAERAAVQAVRASLKFQQAHVVTLRAQLEALKQRAAKGEASADLVDSAARALANAEHLAAEAEAVCKKSDLEFAQNNLDRQQKLMKFGLGSKSQLTKAQTEVQKLQAPAQPPSP